MTEHGAIDKDPNETAEWLESIDDMIKTGGESRAEYVIDRMVDHAAKRQLSVPLSLNTPYVNTIHADDEPEFPGDEELERRYRGWIRWNAAAMVTRAQGPGKGVGGHISSYASVATLYEVGLNHFFRGKDHPGGGDQIYFQGHAAPGMYARGFMEGRFSEEDLDSFRQEKSAAGRGLSSYPPPALTAAAAHTAFRSGAQVSLGLGMTSFSSCSAQVFSGTITTTTYHVGHRWAQVTGQVTARHAHSSQNVTLKTRRQESIN